MANRELYLNNRLYRLDEVKDMFSIIVAIAFMTGVAGTYGIFINQIFKTVK